MEPCKFLSVQKFVRTRVNGALVFNISFQLGYPPFLSIVKAGARRGIEECQHQFNGTLPWNICSFVNEIVDPELPIFVNTTLPFGEIFDLLLMMPNSLALCRFSNQGTAV